MDREPVKGKAKLTRYIEIASARRLDDPEVDALLAAATKMASVPLPASGKGALSIRGNGDGAGTGNGGDGDGDGV